MLLRARLQARNGLAKPAVAALCLISFLVGYMIDRFPGLPNAGRGLTVVGRHETRYLQKDEGSALGSDGHVNWKSFEELVEWSGMLADRPPVAHGDTGLDQYIVQPFQLLSVYPRAYLYPKFINDTVADRFIELASKQLSKSGLALRKGDKMTDQADVRTSSGTFLSSHDPLLAYAEQKIAYVSGIPTGYMEPYNVLRYENGQHYYSHLDAFPEKDYGKQSSQRIGTVLLYLSTVEEGGETVFQLEGKDGLERLRNIDYTKCDTGIKYKPRKGDALLFWDVMPTGKLDQRALHGGCPVIQGTKWAATKWIRNRCMRSGCHSEGAVE